MKNTPKTKGTRWTLVLCLAYVGFAWNLTLPANSQPIFPGMTNRHEFYGPLACALVEAYDQWFSGPLKGASPSAASFTATLNGTNDPYVIKFAPTSGSKLPGASYSIPASICIQSDQPPPGAGFVPPTKGPLTLSGLYVLAFKNADSRHDSLYGTLGDGFAFLSSLGGGVAIAIRSISTTQVPAGTIEITFVQSEPERVLHLGCYKEQVYLVDPNTLNVTNYHCIG